MTSSRQQKIKRRISFSHIIDFIFIRTLRARKFFILTSSTRVISSRINFSLISISRVPLPHNFCGYCGIWKSIPVVREKLPLQSEADNEENKLTKFFE
jgi:hypothetical protein